MVVRRWWKRWPEAQGQVVAVCVGPWDCFMFSTVLAPTRFLQLESMASVFLVVNPVGCWLNLSSFAKARSSVKTEMVFLFSLS